MSDNKITLSFNDTDRIVLDGKNPSIKEVVEKITEIKERINPSNIKVVCSSENFDTEGFEKMISNIVKEYLEKIKINKVNHDNCLAEIKKGWATFSIAILKYE